MMMVCQQTIVLIDCYVTAFFSHPLALLLFVTLLLLLCLYLTFSFLTLVTSLLCLFDTHALSSYLFISDCSLSLFGSLSPFLSLSLSVCLSLSLSGTLCISFCLPRHCYL